MSTGSTLIEVKQALIAALSARPGLAGAQITYGFPVGQITGRDVWLGEATSENSPDTMRGGARVPTLEDYRLTVHLQVIKSQGEGQEAADVEALGLLNEVQQEIAGLPQPTPNVLMVELAGWEHLPAVLEGQGQSCGSKFTVAVRVRARLV